MESKIKKIYELNGKIQPKQEPHKFIKYTLREQEVALLLLDGNSHKMIADILQISVHTVRTVIKNLYIKSQAHSLSLFLKYMHNYPEHFRSSAA